MRRRRIIWASLWVLGGALGCTHQEIKNPMSQANSVGVQLNSSRQQVIPPVGAVIQPEAELPKHAPTAVTCAKYGEYFALSAQEPGMGQAKAQQLRDNALKAYQQALELDPKYVAAYQSMARLYLDLNDVQHASATYMKALQLVPNNAGLWYEMGLALMGHKDFAGGLAGLQKATTLDSENREYSSAYGYALARAGQYDQALAAFQRHSDPATAHYNLARMLVHMQQPALSLAQVRMALAQNPNLAPARKLEAELQGAQAPTQLPTTATIQTQAIQPTPTPAPAAQIIPVQYVANNPTLDSLPLTQPVAAAAFVAPAAKQVIAAGHPRPQTAVFTEPDAAADLTPEADGQRVPPPPMYSMRPTNDDAGHR